MGAVLRCVAARRIKWEPRLNFLQRAGTPRSEWQLDPEFTFLNHGSYGATPRTVIAEQDRWRERMERHPTGFMTYELPKALREAAARLATFVGCNAMDLVFVENATVGCTDRRGQGSIPDNRIKAAFGLVLSCFMSQ